MTLKTRSDFLEMDCVYLGEPFVRVCGNSSTDTSGMDKVYLGEPFIVNYGSGTTSKIKQVHTTPWGSIKNIFGKAISGIKTFGSTSTT